jgi:DNA primase
MAKISPVSIKYMVYANFIANGALEKPDVIGAIFGQTEGLLGPDLEMRELQKEGKIGRIEVELKAENGKTTGKIEIPSALDKEETTLLSAAIETIGKIGPTSAEIKVEKIEDVRKNKREYILERAKTLLGEMEKKMPKAQEITKNLRTESKIGKLKEYGEEKLPAGNLDGKEIIVVEGRADVINLLRNNIDNVIGMDGTKLPETIKKLSYDKEITLFVDGDRGGKLITKNVIENARIDYIAFAPDGKEVEELTAKEILSALRKKISEQEFLKSRETRRAKKRYVKEAEEPEILETNKDRLKTLLKQVENTKSAIILDRNSEVIAKISARNLFFSLDKQRKACMIVIDKATPTVIKAAEKNNVKCIVAKNFTSSSEKVKLISL